MDGDQLSVSGLTADHGTVTNNGDGTYTITPAADYNGTVKLSYTVVDGHGGSTSATQSFSLAAVNDDFSSPDTSGPTGISYSLAPSISLFASNFATFGNDKIPAGTEIAKFAGTGDSSTGTNAAGGALPENHTYSIALISGSAATNPFVISNIGVLSTGSSGVSSGTYTIAVTVSDPDVAQNGSVTKNYSVYVGTSKADSSLDASGSQYESFIFGGGGSDKITGSHLNDVIHAGNDGDKIRGGEGADTMFGGGHDDRFYFGVGESGKTGDTWDVIRDFTVGSGNADKIVLDNGMALLGYVADSSSHALLTVGVAGAEQTYMQIELFAANGTNFVQNWTLDQARSALIGTDLWA